MALIGRDGPAIHMMAAALENEGCGIQRAEDGREGLAAEARDTIDEMFSYLTMPRLATDSALVQNRPLVWQ